MANQYSSTVSVFLGNGDGTFATRTDYGTGSYPSSVVVGDFNADGKADLAVANRSCQYGFGATGQRRRDVRGKDGLRYRPQSGFGSDRGLERGRNPGPGGGELHWRTRFRCCWATAAGPSRQRRTTAPASVHLSVAIGDFNADGKLDLAVANSLNYDARFRCAWARQRDVRRKDGLPSGPRPTSVATGDFNADGNLDLGRWRTTLTTRFRCCWATAVGRSRQRRTTERATVPCPL